MKLWYNTRKTISELREFAAIWNSVFPGDSIWVGVTRHKPDVRRWVSSLNRISPPPGF